MARQIQDIVNTITNALTEAMEASYELGVEQGERLDANKAGITQYLNQIEKMARQIEECHDTIRRRNATIREQDQIINKLRGTGCHCE